MKMPALLKFLLLLLAAYLVLKLPGWVSGKPIPLSIFLLYMAFAAIMILLAMTATEEGARGLFSPMKALLLDPSKRRLRNAVFAAVPVIGAFITYLSMGPEPPPPFELRTVHPAPPALMEAYGRSYNLQALRNPFRALEGEDPLRFRELVREGGRIYFENCFFCHGVKLDGGGHYADGLTPPPPPFKGPDTIAQLSESYVFWRIVKGGQGLPGEAGPHLSSMPSWEESLSEEEVWKVILFLYDYTGNRPLEW